jgi:hypothetical protein
VQPLSAEKDYHERIRCTLGEFGQSERYDRIDNASWKGIEILRWVVSSDGESFKQPIAAKLQLDAPRGAIRGGPVGDFGAAAVASLGNLVLALMGAAHECLEALA